MLAQMLLHFNLFDVVFAILMKTFSDKSREEESKKSAEILNI